MTHELHQLQQKLQEYLLSGNQAIYHDVISTEKVSGDIRLKIYADAYRLRLQDALRVNFPVLAEYLGREKFDSLSQIYIEQYPSTFRSIRWYGDKLADFLLQNNICPAYFSELAKFEWAMSLAFDASDHDVILIEDIAKISPSQWPSMQLQWHPSVHRLTSQWNVVPLWKAVKELKPYHDFNLHSQKDEWIIWRKEFCTQFHSLSVDQAWAIDAAMRGASFGEICLGLLSWVNEDAIASHAASLLKGWINQGFIAQLVIN